MTVRTAPVRTVHVYGIILAIYGSYKIWAHTNMEENEHPPLSHAQRVIESKINCLDSPRMFVKDSQQKDEILEEAVEELR